jgi:GH35 family endo-1,4-beta-xylanase
MRRLVLPTLLVSTLIGLPARAADDIDAAIRKNRMGVLVVTAAPGTEVKLEQTRHEFWFGAALANGAFDGSMSAADTKRYREVFLANFNSAVTENALKWLSMEPRQGTTNNATVWAIL